MHFDGSYTKGQGGARVVLTSPTGDRLKYVVQMHYQGNISNNTMEYEGLLTRLRAAISLGISKLVVKGDSQLVMKQINKEYACPQMAPYVEEVWKLQRRFSSFRVVYVPREENTSEDELSQLASKREPVPPGIYIEVLRQPSISPGRLKSWSASTPGAGDPSTPTTRVASPEAQDSAVSAVDEALLPPAQVVLLVE